MNRRRSLARLTRGSVSNVAFNHLMDLANGFGFQLARRGGSHHIFVHPDIPELLNLQEVKGQAKAYQIRQFLRLVERYNLGLKDEE